uniref:Trigger factor n=1 Tax=Nippostrongylus brasiliensis TaxID=27835 RepID=A0A0N4YNK2_NIPBR
LLEKEAEKEQEIVNTFDVEKELSPEVQKTVEVVDIIDD